MNILKLGGILLFEMLLFQHAHSQDRIFFKNGRERSVLIEKETTEEIYFTDTITNGSRFKVLKSEIKQINYANGDSIDFTAPVSKPVDSTNVKTTVSQTEVRKGIYNCWIYGDSTFSYKMRRAFIHSVADSGILFWLSASGNYHNTKDLHLNYQNVIDIEQLKIRRKGSVGKGMLIGTGVGFFIGFTLGYAGIPQYGILSDFPPLENAFAGGIITGIPGMIIGGAIGSLRVKFPLHKNQQHYEKYKNKIASYAHGKF